MRRRDFLRAAAATALAACAPTTTPIPSGDAVGSMSLERKVGQLMSVAFHGTKITSSLEAMIRDRGIGGVILYSENFTDAAGLAKLVAELDQIARDARSLPLFFEIDQEGGPVIRINKGATILPGQMALAATADPERSVRTAATISAAELRARGGRPRDHERAHRRPGPRSHPRAPSHPIEDGHDRSHSKHARFPGNHRDRRPRDGSAQERRRSGSWAARDPGRRGLPAVPVRRERSARGTPPHRRRGPL